MPIVRIFGEPCRARTLLNAIGAQEALEALNRDREGHVMRGPAQERAYERDRMSLAGRRNAAERRLRTGEHRAWERWRGADPAVRAATYAMLTDPRP